MGISLTRNIKILIAIIFLGAILRVAFVNSSPSSLYGDELTMVLDANSLYKTGHDQLGNLLPLTFQMGAGRPAGYVYGSIPAIALFGPTAVGIRALSILSGIGIILLLYFLGKKLFSERIGLTASAIGAVSPWDIALSRGGFEAHFALFLALLGLHLFLKAKENPKFYIFSALSFGMAIHTYPTYKISLLLFLPLAIWFRGGIKRLLNKKLFLLGALVLFIFGILSISQFFFGGSETRFFDINIFSQGKLKISIEQKINQERQLTQLGPLSKYFYNKPVEYTKVFIENYLQNFSVDFLVLHGDGNPRHNMATMGEVYFVEIALIIIGILSFWNSHRKLMIFLLGWILIVPLPSAIIDLPHALRSSFMLPPLLMLSALGLVSVIDYKKRIIILLIFIIFLIQFIFFIQKLYFLSPNEYSNFWSYPAKLAEEIAVNNKDKYKYIILSDRIDDVEFAYPVYTKLDPAQIIYQNKRRTSLRNLKFKKFDNIYIGYVPKDGMQDFISSLDGSVLYIDNPDAVRNLSNYEIVSGRDSLPALTISRVIK